MTDKLELTIQLVLFALISLLAGISGVINIGTAAGWYILLMSAIAAIAAANIHKELKELKR